MKLGHFYNVKLIVASRRLIIYRAASGGKLALLPFWREDILYSRDRALRVCHVEIQFGPELLSWWAEASFEEVFLLDFWSILPSLASFFMVFVQDFFEKIFDSRFVDPRNIDDGRQSWNIAKGHIS